MSHVTFMHHVAWGVVCLILMAVMGGMWIYASSLESQNKNLKQQLVAAAAPDETCVVTDKWTQNSTKRFSLQTTNGMRDFLVHVPIEFKEGKYYPLIMFYPGKGATALGSGITFGLDTLPAVTVYPFPTIGTDGYTAWQGAPYSSKADDIAFTSSILDKVQAELCIDKTRVYAAGMSNGGGLVSLLSCHMSDRFAGFVIVGGAHYAPYGECKPPRPVPTLSVHGDNDPIVPYEGSLTRRLPAVYDWTAGRAAVLRCAQPTTIYSPTTEVTTWAKCRDDAVVQNIRILGGEHSWGQVSNEVLWQFLSQFSLE